MSNQAVLLARFLLSLLSFLLGWCSFSFFLLFLQKVGVLLVVVILTLLLLRVSVSLILFVALVLQSCFLSLFCCLYQFLLFCCLFSVISLLAFVVDQGKDLLLSPLLGLRVFLLVFMVFLLLEFLLPLLLIPHLLYTILMLGGLSSTLFPS